MTYSSRSVLAQIQRIGQKAKVFVRSDAETNAFNNPESEWTPDREVIAAKTYPNRNTQVDNREGRLHRDRPVFLIPTDQKNDPPGNDDRLQFPVDGTLYELQAPTQYGTHIEIFGEVVTGHPRNE